MKEEKEGHLNDVQTTPGNLSYGEIASIIWRLDRESRVNEHRLRGPIRLEADYLTVSLQVLSGSWSTSRRIRKARRG
jgi:hypothetical protein